MNVEKLRRNEHGSTEYDFDGYIMKTYLGYLQRHFLMPKVLQSRCQYLFNAFLASAVFGSVGVCGTLYIYDVKQKNMNTDIGEAASTVVIIFFFSKYGKPVDFDRVESKLKQLLCFYYYFSACALIGYSFSPLAEKEKCENYKRSHHIDENCGVTFPVSFLSLEAHPYRRYFYTVYQAIALLIATPVIATLPAYAYGFHEHMASRLRHLRRHLYRLNERYSDKKKIIKDFVEHHVYLMNLLDQLNSQTSIPMCIHVFGTSSIITATAHAVFHLTWKIPIKPVVQVVLWTSCLYLNCLGGQKVKDESMSVTSEIYSKIVWYEMDLTTQRDLLIIICRAQKPLVVSTGPFGHMKLSLFLLVLKGIYSLLITSSIAKHKLI